MSQLQMVQGSICKQEGPIYKRELYLCKRVVTDFGGVEEKEGVQVVEYSTIW